MTGRLMKTWMLLIAVLLLASCRSTQNARITAMMQSNNCYQHGPYNYTQQSLPKPIHTLAPDSALLTRFSFRSLNVANAINVLDMVYELFLLKQKSKNNTDIEKRVEVLELTQRISHRIEVAALELLSVSSELDCDGERAEQLANYLKGEENDRTTNLTVAAIGVGAFAAIASGVILATNSTYVNPELVGITTGITEATLGVMILKNQKKANFYHPRNVLNEMNNGPVVSVIFPPSIWYYLNYEKPNKPGSSLRHQIVNQWIEFAELTEMKDRERKEVLKLFLGDGGKYTAEQLSKRANMYDQLDAYINLMKQDLATLTLEIERLNNER